jgi:mono/diheme cytochrome c family protein
MRKTKPMKPTLSLLAALLLAPLGALHAAEPPDAVRKFVEQHCLDCHDADSKKGNLDLDALKLDLGKRENFATWVKVFDRVESGEMPPKKKARPKAEELKSALEGLKESLIKADEARLAGTGRTALRRLTRVEYENTMRDLFDMPGIALQALLPPDGSANGFDKNSDALSISHVNLAKYIEAADRTLDLAIATRPTAPRVQKTRTSLLNRGGQGAYLSMQGDVILLRDFKPDPAYPPASEQPHLDQGAHEAMDVFETDSSVGVFRREDESVNYYFRGHTTIYPGRYRMRVSTWAFQWDKGAVRPARGTEALRIAAVQLTSDGRGGQHPNYTLGYFDAPSLKPAVHELDVWLHENEIPGCDVASLAPVANYSRKGRAMGFTGPGIAVDWLDVEGPLNDVWPPRSHRVMFGELPIQEFVAKDHPGIRAPKRVNFEQRWLHLGKNERDPVAGLWTVRSEQPLEDADKLLASFLPKAFRRPVTDEVRKRYVGLVDKRLKDGDCFETAMRWAVRTALCSPDFLYHYEPAEKLDNFALASRLSFFLAGSLPDDPLTKLASSGKLHEPKTLHAEVERLLKDKRSQRFVEDFLGQWLKLRQIAANDPDKKLYPEFSPYLQESMVAETHAYFRELLDRDLDATHLVRSDFVMINEKLATHYGIEGVSGSKIRRVALPPECPRGGFLTQASILKITANGTTTSPVPRGAFVMDRLLGKPPEPPPPSVPAVEPDVRGATTIRELLDKHRSNATCAGCHAKIDPAGFALESFDVIGGLRTRYRSLEKGDPAPRGKIDPFIGIGFKLGPKVDPSGELPDGRTFKDIRELQSQLAADRRMLLKNLAEKFLVYATGREIAFRDRDAIHAIVSTVDKKGGGVRTLLHEVIQSPLFQTR